MKTPKKKPGTSKSTVSGAKSSNIKPADSRANKRFADDDDDDFDEPLEDLGEFNDFNEYDDDDEY
ncbi:hypothetical protein BDE36_1889 [Arcticibacter tournemirensis]|uniref:Uncharacterized protein n=1 Tax=Arcticibacter tournemirensis TaxID=699437 RepID=A0A5M9H7G8_9SPHI|nr:hypothetical protein [Arcticibacter tournemirensis]KAA8481811.1 hypothetical protein F1649_13780 [Arcticibacter tournemirensis]TQM50153.1 hypothetical protein BDE36_1889 [Arcticibacter tournemirensis]